jgi:hypothetical protein
MSLFPRKPWVVLTPSPAAGGVLIPSPAAGEGARRADEGDFRVLFCSLQPFPSPQPLSRMRERG